MDGPPGAPTGAPTGIPGIPPEIFAQDEGQHIIVSTWVVFTLATIFCGLRVYCKLRNHQKLWWDDNILVASWVMLMASMVPTTINAKQGFGRHVYAIDPQILPSIGLNAALASLFSILASVWSKTSFAITLLRLVGKWTKVLLWFIIVSINIAMILLAILYWVQCTPPDKLWNVMKPGSCWDPNIYSNYGIFASAYSGAMDIVLALLPWRVVWSLQMKKKEKFGIAVAMSMGLFAGVTAMIKTAKIPSLATGDFTYYGAALVIWGIAEPSVTIIAASIPALRVLLRDTKRATQDRYGSRTKRSIAAGQNSATGSDGIVRSVGGTGVSRSDWSIFRGERGTWKDSASRTVKSNVGHSVDDGSVVHSEHGVWNGMSTVNEKPASSPLASARGKDATQNQGNTRNLGSGRLGSITTTSEVLVESHPRPESEVSHSDSSVWIHST